MSGTHEFMLAIACAFVTAARACTIVDGDHGGAVTRDVYLRLSLGGIHCQRVILLSPPPP